MELTQGVTLHQVWFGDGFFDNGVAVELIDIYEWLTQRR